LGGFIKEKYFVPLVMMVGGIAGASLSYIYYSYWLAPLSQVKTLENSNNLSIKQGSFGKNSHTAASENLSELTIYEKDYTPNIRVNNNYINNIQHADINFDKLPEELEHLLSSKLRPFQQEFCKNDELKLCEQKIGVLDTEIVFLRQELKALKEYSTICENENKKKLSSIFKYAVKTNLEQCDIISWIKENLSQDERQKILKNLQSEVIEEALEVARNNNFLDITQELEFLGAPSLLDNDYE